MLTTHKSIKPRGVKIYRNVRNQCLVLNDKSVFLQSDVKVITNVEFYTPNYVRTARLSSFHFLFINTSQWA